MPGKYQPFFCSTEPKVIKTAFGQIRLYGACGATFVIKKLSKLQHMLDEIERLKGQPFDLKFVKKKETVARFIFNKSEAVYAVNLVKKWLEENPKGDVLSTARRLGIIIQKASVEVCH